MRTQTSLWNRALLAPAIAVLLLAVAMGSAPAVMAKSDKAKSAKTKAVAQPEAEIDGDASDTPKRRTLSLTMKQMGAWSSVQLRGVESTRNLAVPIRSDEVVVAAKLRIAYDYSPALIPELSHLKVLLNERVAAVLPLPLDKGVGNSREINLDPRWFSEYNTLSFKFIGHYTRQCEDPYHSSLWLNLSDLSRLELTLAPLAVVNDLKTLPAPFIDRRDTDSLRLPFVFTSTPSFGTLKAAGVVASWFGQQAGYRGAQFPAMMNVMPEGNAVLFMQGNDNIAGIKGVAAPTVSIQPHPTNARAKLLVITGANDEEIARAANAVALIAPKLSGQMVTVTKETEAAARKPYDAPAWVPTDRPVRFGELARLDELQTRGYFPEVIRMNYRVAPDLFTWRTPGVPLNVKYRVIRLPSHRNSSLNIAQDASFIHALAVNDKSGKTPEGQNPAQKDNIALTVQPLFIPPYLIGGRDQLQFSYYFDVIKEGECKSLPPDNLQGSIDAESTVDFSGFPHYVALPNLAYFVNLGFPFTRMADLSETAVVLPERPNSDEIGIYLTVLGRMGEAVGYPALRHALIAPAEAEKMANRDFIVIGSSKTQSLMTKWSDRLPMAQINGERRVREPDARWHPTYRWEQGDFMPAPLPKGNLNLSGTGTLTAMMAFESPLQSARSVVLLYADRAADLRKISDAMQDGERAGLIRGDFSVIDDKSISHAKVGETYYLGALPAASKVRWFFSDHPLWFGLLALLICVILAVIIYRKLRRIMAKRAKKAA